MDHLEIIHEEQPVKTRIDSFEEHMEVPFSIDEMNERNAALMRENEVLTRSVFFIMQETHDVQEDIATKIEISATLNAKYEALKDSTNELLLNGLMERCKRFPNIRQRREKSSPEDYIFEDISIDSNAKRTILAAVRHSDRQLVVVKTLKKARIGRVHQLAKLESEIKILERLKHIGIVQLLDVWETPPEFNIAYERFGQDLFHVMKPYVNEMPSFLISQIAEPLIAVMDYIHSQNVAHSDIKPENIMIRMDGKNQCSVKLTDFKLAIQVGDGHEPPKGLRGSAGFAAPEMFGDRAYNPMKCDIWSFGCVLHELLVGHAAFNGTWMSIYTGVDSDPDLYFSEDLRMAVEDVCFKIKETSPFYGLLQSTLEISPRLRASASELLHNRPMIVERSSSLLSGTQPAPTLPRNHMRRRIEESMTFSSDDDDDIDNAILQSCFEENDFSDSPHSVMGRTLLDEPNAARTTKRNNTEITKCGSFQFSKPVTAKRHVRRTMKYLR